MRSSAGAKTGPVVAAMVLGAVINSATAARSDAVSARSGPLNVYPTVDPDAIVPVMVANRLVLTVTVRFAVALELDWFTVAARVPVSATVSLPRVTTKVRVSTDVGFPTLSAAWSRAVTAG